MTRLLATTLLLLVGCASGDLDLMRNREGECFLVEIRSLGAYRVEPMHAADCAFETEHDHVFGSVKEAEACALAEVKVHFACAPRGEEERDGE